MSIDILLYVKHRLSEFEHHQHHHEHFGFLPSGRAMGLGFGVRRGEFRFLILIALEEKPMHGYALIQEIGRKYQRAVSAGLVYPTLQELEDMDLVSLKGRKGGKKVYSITAKGKSYLKENQNVVERLKAGQEYAGRIGEFSSMRDLQEMQSMLVMNAEYIDREKMKKIEDVLCETKRKVAAIVFE
jgi:DNA-binding PadR family transcriptional regulator